MDLESEVLSFASSPSCNVFLSFLSYTTVLWLHPHTEATRVTFAGGTPKVTDGPFAEAKEVLGGYWMIQVKSREEAIEWAKRVPPGPQHADFSIELRQIADASDFPADVQAQLVPDLHPGWR